ncbi:hypothetical protein M9R32_08590 [Paenisporosarcina quisquiliarum]|uniref:Uncharacterized protein n=1 Tax=Paenisporosarcina quisquiliarum TaxID=365346 RepID=A0A9X3LIT4_9BACL|nr:hypothetical protein [Paenisporosarcina quisquiliarum]MCZ8537234.1 hypothetical protein [Paenisporosarcina quisquiliarum]
MENVRDLFFQQDTLKMLLEKCGVVGDDVIIPWNGGLALTDQVGNITNYLTIDTNGQLLLQNGNFDTISSVSSVADHQFQVHDHQQIIGQLFTSHHTGNLDSYLDLVGDGEKETLRSVLALDTDSIDTIMNISEIIDFY